MAIREALNRQPKLGTAIAISLVVVGLSAVAVEIIAARPAGRFRGEKAFFSDDDGKSFFADDTSRIPPFEHNGRQAVRAYVFSCGGKEFVAYLERQNPQGMKAAKEVQEQAKTHAPDGRLVAIAKGGGREVKRPGEVKWSSAADAKLIRSLEDPRCPDGSGQIPDAVEP